MLYKEMTGSLREAKQRLESDMLVLLSQFEKETGLHIKHFDFFRSQTMGDEYGEIVSIKSEIEV